MLHMRACPNCAAALRDVEGSASAQCPSCDGLWVPSSVLPAAGIGLFQTMLAGLKPMASTKTMSCPDDTTALETLGSRKFRLRRCPDCRGIWLDAGTLARLREEITPRWKDFLTNAFGKGLADVIRG